MNLASRKNAEITVQPTSKMAEIMKYQIEKAAEAFAINNESAPPFQKKTEEIAITKSNAAEGSHTCRE